MPESRAANGSFEGSQSGIPNDFELRRAGEGGENLVDSPQHQVLDQVFGAALALKHEEALENHNRLIVGIGARG